MSRLHRITRGFLNCRRFVNQGTRDSRCPPKRLAMRQSADRYRLQPRMAQPRLWHESRLAFCR